MRYGRLFGYYVLLITAATLETSVHEAPVIVIENNAHHDSNVALDDHIMKRVNLRNDGSDPAVRFTLLPRCRQRALYVSSDMVIWKPRE
jgi:uncharacterized protein YfaQ (DUF2300 family)